MRPTVLIVDDDTDTADMLALVVDSGGFTPLVAYTVPQAIAVANALLQRARPPRLIAMTGLSWTETCPIEFDAYLTKPSCCREIREAIAAAAARWCAP
jgi:CheY-like chemotaxis protein